MWLWQGTHHFERRPLWCAEQCGLACGHQLPSHIEANNFLGLSGELGKQPRILNTPSLLPSLSLGLLCCLTLLTPLFLLLGQALYHRVSKLSVHRRRVLSELHRVLLDLSDDRLGVRANQRVCLHDLFLCCSHLRCAAGSGTEGSACALCGHQQGTTGASQLTSLAATVSPSKAYAGGVSASAISPTRCIVLRT